MKFQFVLTLFICLAMQVLEAAAISVTDYYSITTSRDFQAILLEP